MPHEIKECTFQESACSTLPYYCNFNQPGQKLHRHADFYEFSIIVSGSYKNVIHGESSILSAGSLIYFAPGQVHSLTELSANSHHYSFIIQRNHFETYVTKYFPNMRGIQTRPHICIPKLDNSVFLYLMHLASLSVRSISQEQIEIVDHFLYDIIFHTFSPVPKLAEDTVSDYAIELLRRMNRYNLHDAKVHELYKEYPIAPAKLISEFKQLTGYTIVEYKNKKKMEYASFLLSEENYSISAIADMLHISSLGYFSKQFKKEYGMTPKQWQIAHRKTKK